MHDPKTVAFDICYPWRSGKSEWFPKGRHQELLTIWHNDPETDGSDDSCGWFKRARHGDQAILKAIKSDFGCMWDGAGGWFDEDGKPLYSSMSICLMMFQQAAWTHFKQNRRKCDRFMRRHLEDILSFGENATDSMHDSVIQKYGCRPKEERVEQAASVVYGCILRWSLPWWKHPRWHMHHWSFQFHPWQQLKRRFWDRCCRCGKRGFPKGVCAISDWSGDRIWHSTCDNREEFKPSATG